MLPLSTIATFRDAYLQGTGKFSFLSLAQLLSASARLFFSATLAAVGFGMLGAIAGIVIANVLLLICLVYYTYKFFPFQVKSSIHVLERGSIRRELQYGVLVFFATALVTVYYTSDVLIIKRFFTPEEAGLYSGISAIGKILFFVIGPVFAILISSIKIQNSFIQNSHALAKAMTIGVVIGSICLCTFYLFHDIVVKLMLGNVYLPFSHFLPKVSLVMFLAALVNILILYFLALRRFFLVVVSTLGFASMGLVLFSTPSNIDAIINHLIVSLSVILLALVIVYGKDYFNYRSRV
jgi:O-antigen/teichoic acid export membrane protein